MEQLIEPQKSIAFIKEIFKKYEKSSQEKEREIKELKDNINILNQRLQVMDTVIDRQRAIISPARPPDGVLEDGNNENRGQREIDVTLIYETKNLKVFRLFRGCR